MRSYIAVVVPLISLSLWDAITQSVFVLETKFKKLTECSGYQGLYYGIRNTVICNAYPGHVPEIPGPLAALLIQHGTTQC